MKIAGRLPINTISKKISDLKKVDKDSINQAISASPKNLVSIDINKTISKNNNKSFSVKFLNYVEPYLIKGVRYTSFYTEINHNLKVNDKVFIVGGNYDSDQLIDNDEFVSNSDGYKVLYVDRCQLVLNIEYTGTLPYNEDHLDNFIKIYVADTQSEFDYYSQLKSSRDAKIVDIYVDRTFNGITGSTTYSLPVLHNRFSSFGSYSNNSILYISSTVSISDLSYDGRYFGIQGFSNSTTFTYSNAFLVFDNITLGIMSDISNDFIVGSISSYLSDNYDSNNRIRIGKDFTYSGQDFRKDYVYYFDSNTLTWEIDRTYLPSFITKYNFRNGFLKKGEFNQGLIGSYDGRINYNGTNVAFNLGSLLNVNWNSGVLGYSKNNIDSFISKLKDGLPSTTISDTDNGGKGYNFIYDSNILSGLISSGNFYSTIIGTNSTDNVVKNNILDISTTYSVTIKGGNYNNSKILFSNIKDSTLDNSKVINSYIDDSKSINSEIEKSVFYSSQYTSDKIIKIEDYDENIVGWWGDYPTNTTFKIYKNYKFYLSEESFSRLKDFENFYIDGLKVTSNSQEVLNFFDQKFTISDYRLSYDTNVSAPTKTPNKVIVQLTTKEENEKIVDFVVETTGLTGTYSFFNSLKGNPKYGLPSLDIYLSIDYSLVSSFPTGLDPITYPYYRAGSYSTSLYDYNSSLSIAKYYNSVLSITQSVAKSSDKSSNQKILDFSNAYIVDSDFKSGLFDNSDWISGNYINYNLEHTIPINSNGYFDASLGLQAIYPSSSEIIFSLLRQSKGYGQRYSLNSVDDIIFINGLQIDTATGSSPTSNGNLVRLNDAYQVTSLSTDINDLDIRLYDITGTSSVIYNLPSNTGYIFTTRGAENSWNYIHPLKFRNSNIKSGIFRRAYFDDCLFDNSEFDTTNKDFIVVDDLKRDLNVRKLLISDVILNNNSNTFNSGLVQNSHLLPSSDVLNNLIIYNSIISGQSYNYSSTATGSVTSTGRLLFKNGIIKNSRWNDGDFLNGLFYKNNSNLAGTSSTYNNSTRSYYRLGGTNRYSWIDGNFKGGNFELSTFENGNFRNGSFYNSTMLSSNVTGGIFGKRNLPYSFTRIYTGTFSGVKVVNAELRAEDPTGNSSLTSSIVWNSGNFDNGLFGVKVLSNYSLVYPYSSIWNNGAFNNGDFTDIAVWKNGKFNGGRFTSYWGYPFIDSYSYSTIGATYFAWQDGEFNGGEFGNSSTGTNSTWYTGEFNDGIFYGRFWRNGIFTKGLFHGSGDSDTTMENIPNYLAGFTNSFYGLWYDGFVSRTKDDLLKDKKVFTKLEREYTKKKKKFNVEFKNVIWKNGTFSNTDGVFDESVWVGGDFKNGTFLNSSFNPYKNLLINSDFSSGVEYWQATTQSSTITLGSQPLFESDSTSGFGTISQIGNIQPNQEYTLISEFTDVSNVTMYVDGYLIGSSDGIYVTTFTSSSHNFNLEFDSNSVSSTSTVLSLVLFLGTYSGFNLDDSCVWEDGTFKNSQIFASKWKKGKFKTGDAWGIVWLDGTAEYMNAYNVYWSDGLWRNGNWDGSPFSLDYINDYENQVYPGFANDLITNISKYRQSISDVEYQSVHLNEVFTQSSVSGELLSDPDLSNGFESLTHSTVASTQLWYKASTYLNYTSFSSGYWSGSSIVSNNLLRTSFGLVSISDPGFYGSSNASAKLYVATASGIWDIFDSIVNQYRIEINYFVTYGPTESNVSPVLNFDVNVGYDSSNNPNGGFRDSVSVPISNVGKVSGSSPTNYWGDSGIQTLTYTFKPTYVDSVNDDRKRLYIQKLSTSTPATTLYITNISIIESNVAYEHTYNNLTYSIFSSTPEIGNDLSFPPIVYLGGSDNTREATLRFGNGLFNSGIWENGVWNEGWREDKNLILFEDFEYYTTGLGTSVINTKPVALQAKISNLSLFDRINSGNTSEILYSNNSWIFTLKTIYYDENNFTNLSFVDGQLDLQSIFPIGTKVSVGNIIARDINGSRRLIKDYLTVVGVRNSTATTNGVITLELNVNFPIRSIEKDSSDHLIYVTKNVWLNGAFLNGYFKGVWNNGLFKGFPYITKMVDTQWVDGRFEGGQFRGLTSSYIDSDGDSVYYNSGLVQKFNFKDEDQSISTFDHKYNSWINVNYFTSSSVTIGRNNVTFISGSKEISETNFYSIPTKDVLSSESVLRNNFNTKFGSYRLGWKYKEFQNYLEDYSAFDSYYDTNTTDGVNNFIDDGFTYSIYSFRSALDGNVDFISNTNATNSNSLEIYIGPSNSVDVKSYLDNTDIRSNFSRQRYSYISFDISTTYSYSNFNSNLIDNPGGIDELKLTYDNLGYTFYGSYSNLYSRQTQTITEFFYNRRGLDLEISSFTVSPSTHSLVIDNLKFVETDIIPFFQLGTESSINQDIQIPLRGTSPFIDYSDSNFSLVDNINLSFDIFFEATASSTLPGGSIPIGVSSSSSPSFN